MSVTFFAQGLGDLIASGDSLLHRGGRHKHCLRDHRHGPPLVKAPHWLTHLEYEAESVLWRHRLQELSREHQFLRLDQRGCGLSDHDVEELSFEAYVSDLETVVDAAGFKRFPLFGASQGGAVAIEYASRHPERSLLGQRAGVADLPL